MDTLAYDYAKTQASKSTMTHKHGAVIIHNNEIIGRGHTHHAYYMVHGKSCHAEIAAIHSVSRRNRPKLHESCLMVLRIGNDGQLKNSKPCDKCADIIRKMKIKNVVYSA